MPSVSNIKYFVLEDFIEGFDHPERRRFHVTTARNVRSLLKIVKYCCQRDSCKLFSVVGPVTLEVNPYSLLVNGENEPWEHKEGLIPSFEVNSWKKYQEYISGITGIRITWHKVRKIPLVGKAIGFILETCQTISRIKSMQL
jgi:hypothetical protein